MRCRWRRIALPLGAVALSLAGPERTAVLFQSSAPGSDAHTYSFHLQPGWLLHLSLEQQGADVLARVLAPDGRELFRVDSPRGGTGSEEVWLVADSAGVHRIVVKPWPGSKGRYEARLRALRPATEKDRVNALAEQAYQLAFQREEDAPRPWLEERYLGAARDWESIGRTEREADARYRLGQIRALRGDWQGALTAQRRARELFHLVGARRSEVLALDRIAEAHQTLGELEEARRVRREVLLRWSTLGETRNVVISSHGLCQLAHLAGQAWEALKCYERVLQSWRKLGDRHKEGMVGVDIGTLYTSLGDLERALESFRAALALLPEGSPDRGTALTQIGNTYLRAGLSWRALLWFKKARAAGGQASALTGMGLAWQRLGQPARALPLFQRALALFDNPAEKAAVWCHIGRLHISLEQPWSAMDAFERALSLGDLKARAEALSGMARATRMQGDLPGASQRMEEALDLVESLRTEMARADSPVSGQKFLLDLFKATWLASKQDDYAFLIDLLMERHRLEPDRGYDLQALEINERSLARSLADSLGSLGGVSEPWSSLLDEDTALLEYSLGEERSYLWWVTPAGHATFELPGRAVLETAARKLHRLMSSRRTRQATIDRESQKVAKLLLGPVAPRLSQRLLVIVAPDILQYVPFETLLIDRHEVVRNPSAAVLTRLRARSIAREPSPGLALLGHGVFSPLDDRLPSETRASGAERPRPLPYVDDEVRSVLKRAGRRRVLAAIGFDAVPEVALEGFLGGFPLLHFLGHGMTDPKRPERSRLLLSLYTRQGRPRPGWLTAEKIRELDFDADLVVLSACRTGLGKEVRGEGLVGLSQSVLAAGASSVVASLWNVDDQATAALMERFYGEMLDRGRPPAEALRLAQLSLRSERRWSSPYYWGGFVLKGDWLNKARPGGSP
ncbi:MAG TPA: CHAT domain-containing tetratricopeptide repeat protein [Thermoanaerobaculia bacterium]|nr:CHAT domain-containing tetratricopeptide repeat protein [Thermoanaerobaculia bacterium]